MCDGEGGDSGGDVVCYDDGGVVCEPGGSDGSCGCSLQGCLAFAVFIFVFFFLLPPVYIAFLVWMQDNCNSAFDYSFWIFAALIGIIATAIYFLLRFFKRLYRELI